jgi:hypothetical protein
MQFRPKYAKFATFCSCLIINDFYKTSLSSLFYRLPLTIEWQCDEALNAP